MRQISICHRDSGGLAGNRQRVVFVGRADSHPQDGDDPSWRLALVLPLLHPWFLVLGQTPLCPVLVVWYCTASLAKGIMNAQIHVSDAP